MKFAECIRAHGVSDFPDPNAKSDFDIRGQRDPRGVEEGRQRVQGPAATGHVELEAEPKQQSASLKFAQCIRENGVKDFPDPVNGEPLVNTNKIPSSEPARRHDHPQRRDAEVRRRLESRPRGARVRRRTLGAGRRGRRWSPRPAAWSSLSGARARDRGRPGGAGEHRARWSRGSSRRWSPRTGP